MLEAEQTIIKRGITFVVAVIFLSAGLCLTASGFWVPIKAQLAQYLLQQAWQKTLSGIKQVKPWPWADTWPVAKLNVKALEVNLIVLEDSSGRTLAFGPGHAIDSSLPHKSGTMLISGHRDTHFKFLSRLTTDHVIELQTARDIIAYRVVDIRVIDIFETSIVNDPDQDILILMTCFPFDALLPGGPLRYLVVAEKLIDDNLRTSRKVAGLVY